MQCGNKEYVNKYIYDRIQYINDDALAIGACMAILQSEFLKKGYIWFYRILIALMLLESQYL